METEIWKDIEGYKGYYQVSNLGRVRSLDRVTQRTYGRASSQRSRGRILRGSIGNHGYPAVSLYKDGKRKEKTIHRLMAIEFIPNPTNKPFINHKDGIKTNNRLDNFEWCDCLYNNQHAKENNLNAKGERMGSAKLKNEQVLELRKLFNVKTDNEIAKAYGVTSGTISNIRCQRTWKHI